MKMSHFLTDVFLSVYFIEAALSLCLREDFFIELLRFCCKLQGDILFMIALISQKLKHTHSFSIIKFFHILEKQSKSLSYLSFFKLNQSKTFKKYINNKIKYYKHKL